MSAMKFPVSSNIHVSLVFLRRSTCALTFSIRALEGKCQWYAKVMLLCVRDWVWFDLPCLLLLSDVIIAAWQSDTILRDVLVLFRKAESRQSDSSFIGKADCARIVLPPPTCIAIAF